MATSVALQVAVLERVGVEGLGGAVEAAEALQVVVEVAEEVEAEAEVAVEDVVEDVEGEFSFRSSCSLL